MEPIITAIILRGLERFVIILLGGLSIHYGYRLFLDAPSPSNMEGKLEVEKNLLVALKNAAPGTFFALFGTAVLGYSLLKAPEYTEIFNDKKIVFRGFTPSDTPSETSFKNFSSEKLEQERLRIRSEIENLNQILSNPQVQLTSEQKNGITSTKLSLLRSVWREDWGDFDEFTIWAESGAREPIPKNINKIPASYYRTGFKE